MQIDQILVRPSQKVVIIQYSDNAGRRGNVDYDSTGNATVDSLVSDAQQRVPAERDRPDKAVIELEISELENRLKQLKQSIGIAVE